MSDDDNDEQSGGQNMSHAVMAQRVEPADSLDDFPTPPWATRALLTHVIPADRLGNSVWEPACNRGFMGRPLAEFFKHICLTDLHDYGCGYATHDFIAGEMLDTKAPVDWIITNPPFRLAEKFIARAHRFEPARGVAMLVRTTFLESVGRYERLFSMRPPTTIAQFSERVPMVKGRCDPAASTATAYCWLVWNMGCPVILGEARLVWIPPCRAKLEKDFDYVSIV